MAVNIEYGLAFIGVDYVDEAILQGGLKLVGIEGAGLGDGNGVVIDTVGNAYNVKLVPYGLAAAHALFAGGSLLIGGQYPARLVVVTAVGIANDDIDLLGSGIGERGAASSRA